MFRRERTERRARQLRGYLDLTCLRPPSLALVATVSATATAAEGAAIVVLAGSAAAVMSGQSDVPLHGPGPQPPTMSLNGAFATFAALLLVRTVGLALASRLAANASAVAFQGGRAAVLRAYATAPWHLKARAGSGEIQDLLNTQIARATQAVSGLISLMIAVVTTAVLIVGAVLVSRGTAVAMIVVSAVLFLLVRPLAERTRQQSQRYVRDNRELSADVADALAGARDAELFGVWPRMTDALVTDSARVAESFRLSQHLIRLTPVVYQSAGMAIAGAFLFLVREDASFMAGDIGATALLIIRSLSTGQALQANYQLYNSSLPFCDEILRWVDAIRAERKSLDGRHPLDCVRRLELRSVDVTAGTGSSRYLVARDVDLLVRSGEIVAIVGPSGSGKTTLLETLAGLRLPAAGTIAVNGADLRSYREADVRAAIVTLSQSPVLVGRNVIDAVRFYRDLSDDDVLQAARQANVAVGMAQEGDGPSESELRTAGVSRFGVGRLSGGQLQRIGLARALAGAPSLLLLDEPSSALDARLEAELAATLVRCRKGVAVILVTHRPALLEVCDRVYELTGGRLREIGEATPAAASVPTAPGGLGG